MSGMHQARLIDILLVEDDPGDVRLTREALKGNRVSNRLFVVEDGEEAMSFLRREGEYADAPRPDLVLLDLNLPRKNGREVLEEIKSTPDLRSIPVVVLTTSRQERDILNAYDLNANCYITKPVGWEQFLEVVGQIEHFWMGIVTLPVKGD
ncbi:MAG TPA: response regulator [Nitratidesulfovibrio sp.]|nr:response regulator [Nitratidesulfovibrio sp.]